MSEPRSLWVQRLSLEDASNALAAASGALEAEGGPVQLEVCLTVGGVKVVRFNAAEVKLVDEGLYFVEKKSTP